MKPEEAPRRSVGDVSALRQVPTFRRWAVLGPGAEAARRRGLGLVEGLVGRWVQTEGATGRRWAHWAGNKGLCGRDAARRLRTGSRAADRGSRATPCPVGAVPAASPEHSPPAPRRGPAQRHLLLRDPAAGPGAHDGAALRQTVEPLL